MELNTKQEIFELIKRSGKILILLPHNLTADSVASGLALALFLKKQQKDIELASSGQVPENLKFLPGCQLIENRLLAGKTFVISIDTAAKKVAEVSYQTAADKLNVYIKSEGQEFNQQDLSFGKEKFPTDLIICLDSKSLEDLGEIYERHPDLFFETPKINIDNKAGNEYFGAINLVDVTATSTSEILAGLLQEYEAQLMDEDIATCLLAGIIAKTQSFQHVQTTPKSFIKASELVALGGRQQEIIRNIYKTKSLPRLKLWGRALAKMRILESEKTIYSVLNLSDFEKAEAAEAEFLPTLKEFTENLNDYKIMAILAQPAKDSVSLAVAISNQQIAAAAFLQNLGGSTKISGLSFGDYQIVEKFFSGTTLENLESLFLDAVKLP